MPWRLPFFGRRAPAQAPVEVTPTPIDELMRADWDRRAAEDYRLHIATGHAGSDEAFRRSGAHDLYDAILDGLDLAPDAQVLEIGCGVGRLLVPLSERVSVAHGVDISPVMIEKSKEYARGRANVATRLTDGTLRGFDDASLDLVYSFIVFQHIPVRAPIETYVREAARVLRPGGLLRFQVDGRHRLRKRPGWQPDTYDGYKFSPVEVQEMLARTELRVAEEWGEDSHYHWVTARKGDTGSPRAVLRPRRFESGALREVFVRAGLSEPDRLVDDVLSGRASIKRTLEPWEARLPDLADEELVREIYHTLFGWPPDREGLAFHLAVLRDPKQRGTIQDTVLASKAFRDLVLPAPPDVPWYRWEAAYEACPEAGEAASAFDLAAALAGKLALLPKDEIVRRAFAAILGHPPDDTALEFHRRVAGAGASALPFFLRGLLVVPDARPVPVVPPAERLASLRSRCGISTADPPERRPGESFPGEAAVARNLLRGSHGADDRAFVRRTFEQVLGRPVDTGGENHYASKLAAGELRRSALIKDLLWSEELRHG